MKRLRSMIRRALQSNGLNISRTASFGVLADNLLARRAPLEMGAYGFKRHETDFYNYFVRNRETISLTNSRSQLGQDLWVAYLLRAFETRKPGFFVEFGAYDGLTLSNTYLLERDIGWRGIIAEPNSSQADLCRANRSCIVDGRCVWTESGKTLLFNFVDGSNELGTIASLSATDRHGAVRFANRREGPVLTVSLEELLTDHNAPSVIDYISIDTEGSELEILAGYGFRNQTIKILSVEHNFVRRRAIRSLMARNGFFPLERTPQYFDEIFLNSDVFSRADFQ